MTRMKWDNSGRGYNAKGIKYSRRDDVIEKKDFGILLRLSSGSKYYKCSERWYKLFEYSKRIRLSHDLFYEYFQRNDIDGLKREMLSSEHPILKNRESLVQAIIRV